MAAPTEEQMLKGILKDYGNPLSRSPKKNRTRSQRTRRNRTAAHSNSAHWWTGSCASKKRRPVSLPTSRKFTAGIQIGGVGQEGSSDRREARDGRFGSACGT